jgi:hypothetical protein
MQIAAKVIPVEGIATIPGIAQDFDEAEVRQQKSELLLLNWATTLAVALVCCAWIAIALD